MKKLKRTKALYRMTSISEQERLFLSSNKNKKIMMGGFVSTSLDRKVALNFDRNALIKIIFEEKSTRSEHYCFLPYSL